MRAVGIIPARYSSTRFPAKPLIDIHGKSMIQRVYEQAAEVELLHDLVVATDDERIESHVQGFGGKAVMTSSMHRSGTERCAEIAEQMPEVDLFVNIQGDEPYIQPGQILQPLALLKDSPQIDIATLAHIITDETEYKDRGVVKVVCNKHKEALYFSRSPIPFSSDDRIQAPVYFRHVGIYAYRRAALLAIAQLPACMVEQVERLEQLRWLFHGYKIGVEQTNYPSFSIDYPEDLAKLDRWLAQHSITSLKK